VPLRVVGQLKLTYVVAEGPEGMFLVDQHAAHERTIFDRIIQRRDEREAISQSLLAPVSVELTPSHATTLQDNLEAITAYGFQVEHFGERTYLLRAVPSVLTADDPAKTLVDILDMATLEGLTRQKEDIMAASIACHAAVRAGQAMSEAGMTALLEQLEATPNPHTCPHGRPTMIHFSSYHVEREFGRR
jgi:DNA mismatch repair protein MutL